MKFVRKEMIFAITALLALVMGAMFFATSLRVSAAAYVTLPTPAATAFAAHAPIPYPGP